MADVSRAGEGQQNKNKLRFRRVKVYFQRFPGKIGEAAKRGVSDTPEYKVRVEGRITQFGKLAADGGVEVLVPGGRVAVAIETLGTTYALEVLHGIEAETGLKGQQQRLKLLGYYEGDPDGTFNARTDAAVLDFQADNGLDPNGGLDTSKFAAGTFELDATTYNKLKSVFGE